MNLLQQMSRELSEGYGLTETKKLIVNCYDVDENIWPVVVTYDMTDSYVHVWHINKLDRDYADLNYEIMEAIRNEEGCDLTIEF